MLNIALAQLNPTVVDLRGNLQLIEDAAGQARAQGADLVVYPELALCGYCPGDLLDDPAFAARLSTEALPGLLQVSRRAGPGLPLVVGAPGRVTGVPGKRWHNGLLVLNNGRIVGEYAKQLLPTYSVFDERRHFEPGPDVACVVRVKDAHVGFLICEDGWNLGGLDYTVNPFRRLTEAAVDLVVSINASPADAGKQAQRERLFTQVCNTYTLPLLYVNQVGGQDSLVYDGASFAAQPGAGLVYRAASYATEVRTLGFDVATREFCRPDGAALPKAAEVLAPMEVYRRQIELGLRDYARRCGFQKVVVGSSGGIDSALTLALAVGALGASNVTALAMPSAISSAESVADSAALCANLGVEHVVVPIGPMVKTFSAVAQEGGLVMQGLALENLQARLRGTTLMAYSNTHGHLLLTTGNKSEIAVGYCTLYGDTNGGLGLIGDLYKTEVYALARYLNARAGSAFIPQAILDKEPSAELAPGQKDRDSLPPYPVLDAVLCWLIEGAGMARDPDAYAAARGRYDRLQHEQPAVVARVKRLIAGSEYKRRQAAPLLRLRALAFGSGRQIPITALQFDA